MKTYILILICFFPVFLKAQTSTVKGTLTSESGSNVEMASITLQGTTFGTTSDKNGNFSITNIPQGSYILKASITGFETVTKNIELSAGESVNIALVMRESTNQLHEVMVTAQKREESVQKVPASITVLGAKKLAETRTWNTNDLTGMIPNFTTLTEGSQYIYYAARGISAYSYEPVIQTYIDDVPLFSTLSLQNQLFDINRIEVLRGPQGTLYGRNAIGGVVNIVSNKPTNMFKGRGELSYGNYNQQRYSLAISAPIVKNKFFLAANGTYNKRDGYIKNTFTGNNVEGNNSVSANLNLKYIIDDKWSVSVGGRFDRFQNLGVGLVYDKTLAFANPYKVDQTYDPLITRTLGNVSMVVKREGPKATFTSVSAFNTVHIRYNGKYDYDGHAADEYFGSYEKYGAPDLERNFYQELRLASNNIGSKFQWIVGSVYYKINTNKKYENWTGVDSGDPDAPYADLVDAAERNHGFAGFGQLGYSLTDKLTITGGIRFDSETKKLARQAGHVKEPAAPEYEARIHLAKQFHAVTPKLTLSYEITPAINSYASYSKGFRAGGLNWSSNDDATRGYNPERSDNYEAGLKTMFLNNSLSFNAAVFFMNYKDIQAFTYLNVGLAGGGNVNAGDASIKGFEAELTYLPVKGLKLEANIGYTHGRYKDFTVFDANANALVNYKNNKVLYSPGMTSMTAVQYTFPLHESNSASLTLRGEYRHVGEVYYSFDNLSKSNEYGLVNSLITLSSGHYDLSCWIRNLADKKYLTNVYSWGPVNLGTPRMIGGTIAYKF